MEGKAGAFGKGSTIRFDYPAANYKGVRPRWERRCLRVEHVRPLCEQPLADITIELDPNLDRGEVLVTGHDLDKDAERSFYLDRMQHIETVAIYDETVTAEGDEDLSDPAALDTAVCRFRDWLRASLGIAIRKPRAK